MTYLYSPFPRVWIDFAGQSVNWADVLDLSVEATATWEADALTVSLDNSKLYSDFLRKEMDVRVWLGRVKDPQHWTRAELLKVFDGKVDGVLPHFGKQMTVEIRARDMSRGAIDAEYTTGLSNMTASDFAKWVGKEHHLSVKTVETTSEYDMQTFEKKSHWEILQTMAIREGLIAYVDADRTLHLEARKDDTPVLGLWSYFAEPFDLLSFDPDDSALLVNQIKVVRWIGKNADGSALDGYIEGTWKDDARIKAMEDRIVERVVYSKTAQTPQQCIDEAKSLLVEEVRNAITGTALLIGDPRVVAESKIHLGGQIGRFANTYYVAKATHSLTKASGYRVNCDVQSLEPLASEVYRDYLTSEFDPEEAAATRAAAAAAGIPVAGSSPAGCPDGEPVDLVADWREFGNATVAPLLEANGIVGSAAEATCGPIAAAGLLKAYGIRTDPGKLAARAVQGDSQGPWWSPGGMNGPDDEVKLIASQGLSATKLDADRGEAIRRTLQCIPVIFDTPGHYLLAQKYRLSDKRFFVGNTGSNALSKAAGGADWMTWEEISNHPGCKGAIRNVIVADVVISTGVAPSTIAGAGPHLKAAASKRPDLAELITKYWPSEEWEMAAVVSALESTGTVDVWKRNADTINENYYQGGSNNDLSYGWFQVNVSPGDRHRAAANNPNDLVLGTIFDDKGWTSKAIAGAKDRLLSDPDFEVHAAFNIWKGQGWGAWSTRGAALKALGRSA